MAVDLKMGEMISSLGHVLDMTEKGGSTPGVYKDGIDMVGEFLSLLDAQGYVILSKADAQELIDKAAKWDHG